MRVVIFTIFILFVGIAVCEKYTTKYDNIDLDEILKSDRLLKNYVDCIMDRGKCTPDGTELKKNISDALKTDCKDCSEKQRSGALKVIKHLLKNKKATYDEVAAKYDPDGSYLKKHKEEFEKDGIKV